ncbi:Pentatricopeptide repeat-containing protein, mitochondrial [Glycine soja]|uniref:Pentatricopeptide repeat-containing protein, mitochondrial n=1 Tax=Glycine soja TaxID=3848 RepID=A0A0B2RXK8_GLYSO|nr:Pentatricopeptide repeat-containing protein, mitochondrial [Glycine soja]
MKHRDTVTWNSLITGYVHRREIARARQLFDEMPRRDVVKNDLDWLSIDINSLVSTVRDFNLGWLEDWRSNFKSQPMHRFRDAECHGIGPRMECSGLSLDTGEWRQLKLPVEHGTRFILLVEKKLQDNYSVLDVISGKVSRPNTTIPVSMKYDETE